MAVPPSASQRIRYGLTGLAFVFLLVLLGTAVIRSEEEPVVNGANVVAEEEQPSEPLAELGVAPGDGADNEAENQVQPSPLPQAPRPQPAPQPQPAP